MFGIEEPLNAETAPSDLRPDQPRSWPRPEFRPRALFERFRIEVLCTTDAATDSLEHHGKIRASGWKGRVLPTFRPDAAVNILAPAWRKEIEKLGALAGKQITSFKGYIAALENRRAFFKSMGAVSTDHAVVDPYTDGAALPPRPKRFSGGR